MPQILDTLAAHRGSSLGGNCSAGAAGNWASQSGLEKDGRKARVGKPPSEAMEQPLKAGGVHPQCPPLAQLVAPAIGLGMRSRGN